MHTVWCLVRGRNVARVAPLCVDAAYGLLFHFQPRRALTPRATYSATLYAVTHGFSPVVLHDPSSFKTAKRVRVRVRVKGER